jgi:hypothetical protein
MNEIWLSDNGEPPIMLAVRKPGQVAAQPDASGAVVRRGAASGNPNFDPVTGKFAGKKLRALKDGLEVVAQTVQQGALPTQSGVPTGVDADAWARRLAAVRDAGRTLDDLTAETLTAFLRARVLDVNQVDIGQFLSDVQWQRIADLADALQQKHKEKGFVRIDATSGWIKKVFNNLDGPMAGHLVKILEGRGWSQDEIKNNIIKRVKNKEIRGYLETLYGTPLEQGKEEKPQKEEEVKSGV